MAIKNLTRAQLLNEYASTRKTLGLDIPGFQPHLNIMRMKVPELRKAIKELSKMEPRVEKHFPDFNAPKKHDLWNMLKDNGLTKGLNYRKFKVKQGTIIALNNDIEINLPERDQIPVVSPIHGHVIDRKEIAKMIKVGYRMKKNKLFPPVGKRFPLIKPDNESIRINGEDYLLFNIKANDMKIYKTGILKYVLKNDTEPDYSGVEIIRMVERNSAVNRLYGILYDKNQNLGQFQPEWKFRKHACSLTLIKYSAETDFGLAYHTETLAQPEEHDLRIINRFKADGLTEYTCEMYNAYANFIKRLSVDKMPEYDDPGCIKSSWPTHKEFKKNCVISAIENLIKVDLHVLHLEYFRGVAKSDFEAIATHIKYVIKLHVGKEILVFGKMFLARKRKHLHLKYINNHVVAHIDNHKEIIRVPEIDLDKILSKYESIGEIENLMITKDGIIGVEFDDTQYMLSHQKVGNEVIPINTDFPTVISDYKNRFIQMNNIRPCSLPIAHDFCRHGIMIINDNKPGWTLDMKSAYSNYETNMFYSGFPLDITFEVDRPSNQEIRTILKNYEGFAFCDWENIYTKEIEQRWVTIPQLLCRIEAKRSGYANVGYQKVLKFAVAFASTEKLDTSIFDKHDKRLYHKVLGSMSKVTKYETLTTTDSIMAASKGLAAIHEYDDVTIYYGFTDEKKMDKVYTHITAYVQGYTEIGIEMAYYHMSANIENFDSKITAVYVDGISTTCSEQELLDLKFIPSMYHLKPNNFIGYPTQGRDSSYKPVEYIPCTNKFIDIPVIRPTQSNRFKIIDGSAGTGKSTMIKKIRQMMPNVKILVQSNQQKDIFINDGFNNIDTVDMYLTTHWTHDKPIADFVIIDEYYQMGLDKLMKFKSALLFGNSDQLSIGNNLIYMRDFDYHILTKCYRFDDEVSKICQNILKNFDYSGIDSIDIKEALLNDYMILSSNHTTIEKINDIGLALNLPKVIRWTKTDLKKSIYAGDMGIYKNGVCYNNRNGKIYNTKPGRITGSTHPAVVYAFARTYHSTQGQEFPKVCCIMDGLSFSKRKHLYTGVSRIRVALGDRAIMSVKLCSLQSIEATNVINKIPFKN